MDEISKTLAENSRIIFILKLFVKSNIALGGENIGSVTVTITKARKE